jgi:hypothetical protein
MEEANNMRATWEKVLEYASVPLHGTMSRKLRKGVKLQINEGRLYEKAVLFIDDKFVRFTETPSDGDTVNSYYDMRKIALIRTFSDSSSDSSK